MPSSFLDHVLNRMMRQQPARPVAQEREASPMPPPINLWDVPTREPLDPWNYLTAYAPLFSQLGRPWPTLPVDPRRQMWGDWPQFFRERLQPPPPPEPPAQHEFPYPWNPNNVIG